MEEQGENVKLKKNLEKTPSSDEKSIVGSVTGFFRVHKRIFYRCLLGIFIIAILLLGALYPKNILNYLQEKNVIPTRKIIPTPTPTPKVSVEDSYLTPHPYQPLKFAFPSDGKMHFIDINLNLVVGSGADRIYYYSAGEIPEGLYKGYKRVVVFLQYGSDASHWGARIFASKDLKTYIMDGDPKAASLPMSDPNNPFNWAPKGSISKVDHLDQINPKIVDLPDNFALFGGGPTMDISFQTGLDGSIQVDDLQKLNFSTKYLAFYAKPNYDRISLGSTELTSTYLDTTTEIIALDNAGLAYSYFLTTKQNINSTNGKSIPFFGFTKEDIFGDRNNFFSSYMAAFSNNCNRPELIPVMKNISDSELTKVGSEQGNDLYTLNNKSHPLYVAAYNAKNILYNQNQATPTAFPSFDSYVAQNPLLFLKDPWGRWIAVGENQFAIPQCGI